MSITLKTIIGVVLLFSITACTTVGRSSEELKAVFALRAEAEALYQQGDYSAALTIYQALSQQVPEHIHTWFRIGNCQAQLGNYADAVVAYQTTLALDPQFSRAWLNLAYVQAQQLADTAIAMYQVVPAGDPETQRIYTLVQGVLAPFGDTLDTLPTLQEESANTVTESIEQAEAESIDTVESIEPVNPIAVEAESDHETAE